MGPHTEDVGVPDDVLAMRCGGGDRAAFAELVGRHRQTMYAVCLRITGDRESALDAVQEALLRVWKGLPRFRREARLSTWLYRIAVNAALAEVGRARLTLSLVDTLPADLIPVGASATRSIADTVADRMTIERALLSLPPPYRAAIVLREVCDCTYTDIAEILDIPVNTVKSRISRARQALVALLAPAGGFGGER
jgi:RNA polymerase sigma factor (sigma-70 family)